ncbi:MAG: DUF4172 domain-containing protein [Negativicutes bacterium]
MAEFIHQLPDWPCFFWKYDALAGKLAAVRHRQGRLIGRMESAGFSLRDEAALQTLTLDVLKSSEIEGEKLDEQQVRSSIARRLGMDIIGLVPADRNVEGVVEMMLDATRNYAAPLTKERLFHWHVSLFPAAGGGISSIKAGVWRDDAKGPMQIVSGAIGREEIYDGFEGKLTSTNWAKLTQCSQDTATRDIKDLVSCGILLKDAAGGRSTSYSVLEEGKG